MPQAGYVYIMHGIGTDIIKVGKTTNILKRLQTINQGVPFSMQLLYVELMHDMDLGETALKTKYRIYNLKGEWFKLPPELLSQWPVEDKGIIPLPSPAEAKRLQNSPGKSARAWLRSFLGEGQVSSTSITSAAQAVGISKKTLRRAKEALQVKAYKEGNAWYWRLAEDAELVERGFVPVFIPEESL